MAHIISRYNHTVDNPNATYGNDLDKIASGLSKSFDKLLKERGLKLDNSNIETLQLPNYTIGSDGKYYKYNMEIDGVYYCPGNVIIEYGEVKKLENPESKILIDYFIIDTKQKTIEIYDKVKEKDSFVDFFKENKIENISKKNVEDNCKIIEIELENYDEWC